MNRTIEQWQKVDCEHVAKNASQAHVMYLLQDAVSDLQELARQRGELLAVLESIMPWVVTQEVACHGLKCREPVCMSCSSDSEEAAEKATYAYEEARAVIQKVRGVE